MPTYAYRCEACGKSFTQEQTITEHGSATPACPKCGSHNVVQSFSTMVFVKTSKKS